MYYLFKIVKYDSTFYPENFTLQGSFFSLVTIDTYVKSITKSPIKNYTIDLEKFGWVFIFSSINNVLAQAEYLVIDDDYKPQAYTSEKIIKRRADVDILLREAKINQILD